MNKLIAYIKDSYAEMRDHVTWPKVEELQKNTVLVLVASVIFALVIGLMDVAFEQVMTFLYTL